MRYFSPFWMIAILLACVPQAQAQPSSEPVGVRSDKAHAELDQEAGEGVEAEESEPAPKPVVKQAPLTPPAPKPVAKTTPVVAMPPVVAAPKAPDATLFEDDFNRPDGESLGPKWIEYVVRREENGVPRKGETAWSIRNGALHFESSGAGSYVEDFVQTALDFPVDNVRLEFDVKAVAGTKQGYVGPTAFLSPEAKWRSGALNLAGGAPGGLLGVEAWYRWENGGTKGLLVFRNGSAEDFPDAIFSGLNEPSVAHHVIVIKGGKLSYSSPEFKSVDVALSAPLGPDARRFLSFGARLYDKGVEQVIDIDNVRLTRLDGVAPPPLPVVAKKTDLEIAEAFLRAAGEKGLEELSKLMTPAFREETSSSDFEEFQRELKVFGDYQVAGKAENGSEVILALKNSAGRKAAVFCECKSGLVDRFVAKWGVQ